MPTNQLIIMTDSHWRDALGCYGHPLARTPHLDALAARGTRFAEAWCTSPLCVPSRASFATGRYVHEIGAWDNAHPYLGKPPSWAHRLREAGQRVTSIGKLHYRDEHDDTGFARQILPMHMVAEGGDLRGLLRDPLPPPRKTSWIARDLGAGDSKYIRYDAKITEAALSWLREAAAGAHGAPWTLFLSFISPHPPHRAPAEFMALYPPEEMDRPPVGPQPPHPWLAALRQSRNDDDFFDDDKRRLAVAGYLANITLLDGRIGEVLSLLDTLGLSGTTRVLYTSDHGDMLGARGIWGKHCMHERALAVPLIAAGPGVPSGHVCRTPASLLDLYATALDGAGMAAEGGNPAGRSLWRLAAAPDDAERVLFAEYHAQGSASAAYAVRRGRWKANFFAGFPAQLFDVEADPGELHDLASSPTHAGTLASLDAALREVLDPVATDRRAREDQAKLIAQHGGRDRILARGMYEGTPPPGEAPVFRQ